MVLIIPSIEHPDSNIYVITEWARSFSLRITSTLTKEIKIGNLNHIELA